MTHPPATQDPVIHPVTSEVLTPDTPAQDLASGIEAIRDLEWQARAAKSKLTVWLVAQMDQAVLNGREKTWTQRPAPGLTISCPSSARGVEYDGAELFTALMDLVEEGVIGIDAANQCVEQTITYKVNRQPLKRLMQASGRVAEAAGVCAHPVDVERRVKISRSQA